MAARLSPLFVVEAVALVAFVVLLGVLGSRGDVEGVVVPIDVEALSSGSLEESWMGVYFQGQKVGYAVSSQTETVDGGQLLRNRSAFELAAFGEIKTVVTAFLGATLGDERYADWLPPDDERVSWTVAE